jgi:23S rRNA pseudouridine1911/1915/1917 synthase
MDIDILFENNELLVINKPAGLMVHGDGKSSESTLVDWILKERSGMAGVGEPMIRDGMSIDRPGIVHRLDRETSGVMILPKTQESFHFFKQAFKDRTITKEYHAFVWGQFKESSGIVDVPIARSAGDFRRWQAGRGTRGEERDAVTKWQVLSSFEDEEKDLFSFMALSPKTGRTHQLRVHMKYLQRPIVSDTLYAPTKREALGFSRVALHARSIRFIDQYGQEIAIEAPYPADFKVALARYVKI